MKYRLISFTVVAFVWPRVSHVSAAESSAPSGLVRVVTQPGPEYADDSGSGRGYPASSWSCTTNTGGDHVRLSLSLTDIKHRRPPPTPTLVNRARGYGNVLEKKWMKTNCATT